MRSAARALFAVLLLTAAFTTQAQGAAITFTGPLASTLNTFKLQTGAVNVVGTNLPNLGYLTDKVLDGAGIGNDNGLYTGTATLSFLPPSSQIYSGTLGTSIREWSSLLGGPDVALSDQERLVIAMPYKVYSMGFEFHEPSFTNPPTAPPDSTNSATAFDSRYTVTLYNGAAPVHSFGFNATDNVAYFVGIWTDFAFDKIDINETTGGIDNEYFNRVYAGTTAVPEPATLSLLGLGLAGVARAARRRKK